MNVLTEELARPAHYIVWEDNPNRCREQIMIAAGSGLLKAGAVLGILLANHGAVTVGAPAFAGTGNGVLTKAGTPYGAGVQEGTYHIELIDEGANAGDFEVVRPDGGVDGFASVGAAYDGQVKFTIADGATDFASPAAFTLPVTIADPISVGKYVPFDPDGTDGSEIACAVLYEGCDATNLDVRRTVTARDTSVQIDVLSWSDNITDVQKTAALASLAARGIIGR